MYRDMYIRIDIYIYICLPIRIYIYAYRNTHVCVHVYLRYVSRFFIRAFLSPGNWKLRKIWVQGSLGLSELRGAWELASSQ